MGVDPTLSGYEDVPPDEFVRDDAYDPSFFRAKPKGAVHVIKTYEDAPFAEPESQAVANLMAGRKVMFCGKRIVWHKAIGTGCFDDSDLCRACVHAIPEDKRNRLFEHEVPHDGE